MLNMTNGGNITTEARNQYRRTLKMLTMEALRELAAEEHGIHVSKRQVHKAVLIEKILNAKYGKENTP
jgi:hypothetical protein